MKTGLFIGRFQPFHLGHLSAIRQALAQVDFLIIAIGSSQYSRTEENPYTAIERRQMITESLKDEKIPANRIKIVEIQDIHNDAKWLAHVRSLTGDFEILFTGSENTGRLFEKYDSAKIRPVEFEVKISATEVRETIQKNGDWQSLLPKAVTRIINSPQSETRPKKKSRQAG